MALQDDIPGCLRTENGRKFVGDVLHIPKDPWDWYIYLHEWLMFMVNVGNSNPFAPNRPRFAYPLRSPYWLNFQESLYNHLRGIRKIDQNWCQGFFLIRVFRNSWPKPVLQFHHFSRGFWGVVK